MHLGLELFTGSDNISVMVKENTKSSCKDRYTVAGVTRDGVSIIKVGRSTHFTDRQARDAVIKVRSHVGLASKQGSSRLK